MRKIGLLTGIDGFQIWIIVRHPLPKCFVHAAFIGCISEGPLGNPGQVGFRRTIGEDGELQAIVGSVIDVALQR